jgi:hypothetical protein
VDESGESRQHTPPTRTRIPRRHTTTEFGQTSEVTHFRSQRQVSSQPAGGIDPPVLWIVRIDVGDAGAVSTVPAVVVSVARTDDFDHTGWIHQDRAPCDPARKDSVVNFVCVRIDPHVVVVGTDRSDIEQRADEIQNCQDSRRRYCLTASAARLVAGAVTANVRPSPRPDSALHDDPAVIVEPHKEMFPDGNTSGDG